MPSLNSFNLFSLPSSTEQVNALQTLSYPLILRGAHIVCSSWTLWKLFSCNPILCWQHAVNGVGLPICKHIRVIIALILGRFAFIDPIRAQFRTHSTTTAWQPGGSSIQNCRIVTVVSSTLACWKVLKIIGVCASCTHFILVWFPLFKDLVSSFQRCGVPFPKVWCPLSKGWRIKTLQNAECRTQTMHFGKRQLELSNDKILNCELQWEGIIVLCTGCSAASVLLLRVPVCQCAPASPYHSHFTLPAPYLAVCNQKPTLHRSAHCQNPLFPLRAVCIAVYYPRD